MRKFLVLLVFSSVTTLLFPQAAQITGKVISSDDNLAIPGVSVIVRGTSIGVATDIDGNYSITVPEGSRTLEFSFLGMATQVVQIEGRTTIDVVLQPDLLMVDEVLVVAYGSAKKSAFTGSATQIDAKKIEARPVTNVTKAIEGSSAGVIVDSGSGQPGSGQNIRIRGFGSYNASSAPLYVVDGVPYSGDIAALNSNDVESVTLLKDAASSALYGNKAANGVVMITTKKGKAGSGKFTVSINQGVTSRAIPEYDRVGAYDYYPLMWEALRNDLYFNDGDAIEVANQTAVDEIKDELGYNPFNVGDNQIVDLNGKLNPNAKLLYADDLDWQDQITRTGSRGEYNVTYQGGNDNSDYFVSLGYLNEKGYTIRSDYQRFTGRLNVNQRVRDWLKTGLNINGATSTSEQAYESSSTAYVNPFFFTRRMGPIYPVYLHEPGTGNFILDDAGNKIYDQGNMTYLGGETRPSGASSGRHVIAETLWNDDIDKISSVGAKTYLEFTIMKDFRFTTNVSIDKRNYYNINYDNKIVGDGAPAGRAGRTSTIRTSINFNQLLNYTKSFGSHNVVALLGHENYDYEFNYFDGFKQGQIVDGNSELINFTTVNDLVSYSDFYTTEGYFGRLDYNFDEKYYLTASYRRDGSSKFYSESRWGDFWSLGFAWRIDKESFMSGMEYINMMKLRGSYGEVGNDSGISFYAYKALYDLGYNNAYEPGVLQSSLSAHELVWESNNSFDIGLEFGFFSRIYGTLEFYHRISDNLLFDVPLPVSSGLDSRDENVGAMFNQGLEFTVSADILNLGDFRWNINLNMATLKNEFTKLPQEEIIDGSKKLMVGHSIYDYWLKDWYGVDPDDGAALYVANNYSPTDASIRIIGNDTLDTDQNNAKYIYAGTSIPDLMGGVTNSFSYKGFELSFMFTYQIGGKVLDYNYQGIMSSGNYGAAMHADMLNRWQEPGDVTDIPRMDAGQTSNFNATSDRWLVDASFLNFKQLYLAYNLPKSVTNRLDVKEMRLYVSGENLYMINARKGMDVQQSFNGTTSNAYTPARIISAGINVTF